MVDHLRGSGREVRVLSRSGRPGTLREDLAAGEGLEGAVEGAETVVHCASSLIRTRRVDVEGTERLLQAASRAGASHFLFISIVGVECNPYFPYYAMKLEVERIVERSAAPWTILRATQFHDFMLRFIRLLGRLPVMLAPRGFLFQPVDGGEVAGRVPDIGGPEARTVAS